jgi:hypothetical protein
MVSHSSSLRIDGSALGGMQALKVHGKYIIRASLTLPPHSPIAFSDTFSRAQPRLTMSAAIFHSAEHNSEYNKESEDENTFAFMPPSPTTVDPRRGGDLAALSQRGNGQQQGACPAANITFPSPTFNPSLTTAVPSNEVRVSLSSGEGSDGEPRSRPVTRVRGESIVGVQRGTAGDAEYDFSEDMDRTVLEDVQAKAPPLREGSIK